MAYVGGSPGWGYKRVDFINTAGTQFGIGDAGKIFVLDADMAASAQAFVYLPLLTDVEVGYTAKFIVDASTSNDLTVIKNTSDDACIHGHIHSSDGGVGEDTNGTAVSEVNFLSNCVQGDNFSIVKVGNGTTSWWQVTGNETDANHMSFA